jgi:hypothetical protein
LILEAFAQYLQAAEDGKPATDVLARWLFERLSVPPVTVVDRVLHCEVRVLSTKEASAGTLVFFDSSKEKNSTDKSSYIFRGTSSSGSKLLKALYEYSLSYEQQKWARWVHSLKASDFKYCK